MEAESERIQKLLSELAGKDVSEVIAAGKKKLAAMPAAGPAAAGPAAAGGAAPAAKKEEKKVEKEESDQVGGTSFSAWLYAQSHTCVGVCLCWMHE